MTLADVDIARLVMAPLGVHVQPECRCPSSHPHVTDTHCEDISGTSQLARTNENSRDITHINDGDSGTFWRSRSGDVPVNITVSLGGLRAALISGIHFKSFPPGAMAIHYSSDGVNFTPRQYFASDCSVFNLSDNGLLRSQTDVNCITTYSVPVRDHFTEFRVLDIGNRPGAGDYLLSPDLQKFAEVTHIRFELTQFLSTSSFEDRYFAVNEIIVRGQECICNGHAESCDKASCVCQHNTAGPHCEFCLPLFNNKPWAAGTVSSASECEECDCNGHAESCEFVSSLNEGVCLNCTHNTIGDDCGTCAENYYNPPEVPFDSTDSCQPCGCSEEGVTGGDMDCARGDRLDGGDTGQCDCKSFTSGRTCSECSDGYFNLSSANPDGCQECRCVVMGTVGGSEICDKETGQCPCERNVVGRDCSQCALQHYGLGEAEGGCLPCDEECDECTGAGPENCLVGHIFV